VLWVAGMAVIGMFLVVVLLLPGAALLWKGVGDLGGADRDAHKSNANEADGMPMPMIGRATRAAHGRRRRCRRRAAAAIGRL